MPILVQVDDETLEFPDDMSDSDIQSVLQKEYPPPNQSSVIPFDDPLMVSAANLAAPDNFQIDIPSRGEFTAAGGPQIRTPGDGSFGRDVAQGIRGIPSAAGELTEQLVQPFLAPTEIGAHDSIVGLTPEIVPTGAAISQSTGLPRALTVPASGAGRALAGLGQFMTSPVGATEVGISMIPGIGLVQRAKFIKDMAQGAGESSGRLSALVESSIRNPDKVSDEDAQSMAEESANTLLMMFGAGKLTSHQFSQLTGVRAPLGRVLESERTRLSKDLAEQLKRDEPLPDTAAPEGIRQLGIPQASLTAEPFLQPGVPELANAALREAQGPRIEIPGELSALETLRREIEPPRVELTEPTRLAERFEGGGEAPYGKITYRRPAEEVAVGRSVSDTIELSAIVESKPVEIGEMQGPANQQPLKSVVDRIREQLERRDLVAAVDTLSKQPASVQAKTIGEAAGVGKKKVPLSAAERTIFNELWDKAYQESLQKGKPAEAAPSVREMRPIEPGRGEEINAPSVEDVRAQRALDARQAMTPAEAPPTRPITEAIEWKEPEFNRYKELRAQQVKMQSEGRIMDSKTGDLTPEWMANMREFEALRNRHNGMPPIQVSIADNMGLEFRGSLKSPSGKEVWSFHDPKTGSNIGVNRGSTFEQAVAKVESSRAKFAEESSPAEQVRVGSEPSVERVTPLDPQSGSPLSAMDSLINRLEALKMPEPSPGQFASPAFSGIPLPHPQLIKAIGASTWNSAVDVAIASVKAGKAIKEAVDDALAYLRRQGKKFDENQARANMEYVASQETRPATASASAARPSIKAPTLDDIYKIFEPAPKARPGVKETAVKAIESIRTGFSSRFRPLDKLAEDIAKAYGTVSKKGIAGIFEQLKGSSGKAEADIYRFDQAVSNRVRGAEKDFSAYMFLRRSLDRLNQDISDRQAGLPARRSVSSYTIPELQSKLDTLEKQLGPEKLKTFQETSDLYQQQMDASLRLQVESGRMSQGVYNAIKEGNQFYAPFKVLKYIEEGMKPEGTSRKVDTLADFTKAMEGIESPDFKLGDMLGAARQNIALSRILAEKNNTMRKFADLADQDVNSTFTQKLKPGQEAPMGMEVVNVLRNGKQERYAVNRDVAQAVQLFGDTANSFGARVLRMAGVPFRAGATALNIPFQFGNLLVDSLRASLASKYGVRGVTDLIRYPLDMADALFASMAGNLVGYKNKLFLDFLDSGAAGTTIQEYLTPQGLKFQKNSIPAKLADKALYSLPNFSTAIEQMSKVLGVKRAMRITGTETGKELAAKIPEAITEIRRFSGSPDFGRQGRWVEEVRLNLIYMFLNARIQGTTADVGRLIGRDGAKEAALMWGKMGLAVGVPTAYLYSLNRSSEYADDYDKRPKQEKENYWLIPKDTFITNEQGEKMRDYWRIPKRESAKWISNSLEAAMDFAEKKDTATFANWAETMMEEITPVNIQGDTFPQRLESVGASLNPIIKAPLELATGRDMYRHRDTVPDAMQKASPSEQYTDRTAEVFKSLAAKMPDVLPDVFQSPIMLESLVRNLSAGLVTQFLPRRPVEGRSGVENAALLQRFQSLPYTDQEKFKTEMESLERSAADEQVKRYRNANNFVRENKSLSIEQKMTKAAQDYPGDFKQIERILDLVIAEKNGITSQERQILALPVAQRAQYLASQLEGLDSDKKESAIRNYAIKRILTEGVASELDKIMNPQPSSE